MPSKLDCLILTGGQSRRMGADKARMSYHGVPQWRYLADLPQGLCAVVFWSCTPLQKLTWGLDETHGLLDQIAGIGPAGGLATAFSRQPSHAWLVLACDYPLLNLSALSDLLSSRRPEADATAFRNPVHGGPEPLIAIWELAAQAALL